ncbi:hypothetical protein SLE2022_387870 [Rubroshorea leprosula]
MGEAQEVQLEIMGKEAREGNALDDENTNCSNQSIITQHKTYKWWLLMAIFALFLLVGQSAAILLGRLYFDKGGKSKWMATLVQPCGVPVLVPLYFLLRGKGPEENSRNENSPSVLVLVVTYVSLGVIIAVDCFLYSLGLLNLPVSTYSLICASQLAFNAFFSFFLNSQKFTPFIINSLVLLTISSILLVFQNDSSNSNDVSKGKYAIGFICTVVASAGYGLLLSLIQFVFQKVLKRVTHKAILDMIIYPSIAATCFVLVGLFASGEWKSLKGEMEEFKLGRVSYLMTLIWTAICWQVFSIGSVGLIFEVSALFSNVISTLGLPVVPVLAVVFFNDKMNGVKVISMVLAMWGFVSYVYQHYLDDHKSKTKSSNSTTDQLLLPKRQSP